MSAKQWYISWCITWLAFTYVIWSLPVYDYTIAIFLVCILTLLGGIRMKINNNSNTPE